MAEKNEMNAWGLLAAPIIIAAVLSQMIPAYEEYFDENWKVASYYLAAVVIGLILFRRSRSVRDHEFHRAKSIKGLKKAYAAEDRGLWTKADAAMAGLEEDAEGYEAREKELIRSKGVDEIEKKSLGGEGAKADDEPDVHLFIDEDHVKRSTSRIGDTNIDPEAAITGETMEQMKQEKSSILSQVSDKLEDFRMADTEKQAEKVEKKVEPKPAPPPKPTSTPQVNEEYEKIYGGETGAMGTPEVDSGMETLAESTGGGGFSGKEAKICIDCGARNSMSADYCSKCSGFLT